MVGGCERHDIRGRFGNLCVLCVFVFSHASPGGTFFVAGTPKTTFLKHVQKSIRSLGNEGNNFDPFFFTHSQDAALQAFRGDIFGVQCVHSAEGRTYCGAAAFGVTEARWVMEGKCTLGGFRFDPNTSYSSQVDSVSAMPAVELNAMLRKPPNFVVGLSAGSFAIVPAGYIVVEHTPVASRYLKWGMYGEFHDETPTLLRVVSAMVDASPRLKTTKYLPWLEYLQEAVKIT